MKKLLFISTLLAAGTLAASAATTLPTEITAAGGTTYYLHSAWTALDTTIEQNITSLASSNNLILKSDVSLTESWVVGFTLNVASNAGTADSILSLSTSGASSSGYIFFSNYTAANATTGASASLSIGMKDRGGIAMGVRLANIDLDETIYLGYISYAGETGKGIFFIANGDNIATTYILSTDTGAVLANDSSGNTSRLWTNSAKETFTDVVVYKAGKAYLTAIPEPSMFGLLAGTLALGLAGTRRRRH